MNQNLYRENNKNTQISIPLFVPVFVIIIFIVIFMNLNTSNSSAEDADKNEVDLLSETPYLSMENQVDTANSKTEENDNEIVENIVETDKIVNDELQSTEVETFSYTASDGKVYDVIGILNIPSLEIEYPILSSTSDELLNVSLNKYWGPNPNEVGNMVVLGHNYNDGKFFSALPNIDIGAYVEITDLRGRTLRYKVYDTFVIDPYDNACTSQLTDGHTEITLITCYNNGTTRFVVKARAN